MANSSQRKRVRQQRYIFLLACLASLAGLIFYSFCRYRIPFPTQWLPNIDSHETVKNYKLFFTGIGIHLQINFALGLFFTLINPEKMDQVKLKKWKYWISKALIFILSLGLGLANFGDAVGDKWGNIFLLCLIITVINCCLIELLIQLMDQYGICSAFNLILFVEFLPIKWLKSRWTQQKAFQLFFLFIITIFFIWITNLKWEAPIDTNNLYTRDSKVLKRKSSKLGFKLSFSFMPLIYLSQFISFIYSISLMRTFQTNWTSRHSMSENWKKASVIKQGFSESNPTDGKNFWTSLFTLNENKRIFQWENIKSWFSEKKWVIIGALFFLIFLRWLVIWIQMRHVQWKPEEVNKDLRKRGIYINGIAPGRPTRSLLKLIINKMVFLWNVVILVFNVIFDNLFSALLTFSNWFGGVNIGVDLIKQVRTKYRYIQTNK